MKNDKIIFERVPSKNIFRPCEGCFFRDRFGRCAFRVNKLECTDKNGVEYIWKLKEENGNGN